MAVYTENEKDIRKSSGVPFWDYATTINNFDESFLMVPIVENKRVVAVLQVPRKGSKVYFYYSRISEQINFFQGLIFTKHKKAVFSDNAYTNKSIICTTQTYAFWYPADESNPDPESGEGSWEPRTVVVCRELLEDCVSIVNEFGVCDGGGGGGNDNPGYDYPGEVEEPTQLPHPKDPCAKIKEKQNNVKYADKFNALNKSEIFNMNRERGFYEKQPPLGVNVESGFVQIDGPPNTKALDLPDDTTGISGLFHSHNNADGSIKIFSPTDVRTFINTFLKNAGTYGGGYSNAYSTVVTSAGSYTIKYTRTTHLGGVDYYTAQSWNKWYRDEMFKIRNEDGDFPQDKVEAVFTKFLQEVVNKPGLEIFKVTANTAAKMTYNPITKVADKVDCPQ